MEQITIKCTFKNCQKEYLLSRANFITAVNDIKVSFGSGVDADIIITSHCPHCGGKNKSTLLLEKMMKILLESMDLVKILCVKVDENSKKIKNVISHLDTRQGSE